MLAGHLAIANAYCAGDIDQLVGAAEVIFIGTAKQQSTFPMLPTGTTYDDSFVQRTTFRVTETLKGEASETISIWTCPTCGEGMTFHLGEQKLVGASMHDGKLRTSFCSLLTHSVDEVKAALRLKATP